jgi:hypothetical protein
MPAEGVPVEARQFTVTLKYQVGELAEVARILGNDGVNILGLFAREVEEHAVVRLVVDDAIKTERLFRENGIEYTYSPGLLVIIPHEPGALYGVTSCLAAEGIGIIHLYMVVLPTGQTAVVFKLDEMEDGYRVLREAQFKAQWI